jgi:hypothetical protein
MVTQGCLIKKDDSYYLIDWNDFNDKIKEGRDKESTTLINEKKKWKKIFCETGKICFIYSSWRL